MNQFQVVKDFEQALADYTGAKYAVTTTSCTAALLLACRWHMHDKSSRDEYFPGTEDRPGIEWMTHAYVEIPKRTYVSVPQSIKHAGFDVSFRDEEWSGMYQLKPLPIWDSARLFTSGMYVPETYQCLSFHWSKTLAIGQGGAILHDDPEADEWFRKARFDGRTEGVAPKDDNFDMIGYHCYMSPRDVADGLSRLAVLPKHNDPLPNDCYPDLSQFEIFR